MDKIDLLMQAEAITKSVEVPNLAIPGFHPHANITFEEPIVSYLSGDMIEQAQLTRIHHEGETYTGFYHEEQFGKTPKFFTLYDLEEYLKLMLRTPRTISIEEVETTHDIVLADGSRSGLFAEVPADLPSRMTLGKIGEYIKIKSVRDERDIPEPENGCIVVRCSLNLWEYKEENGTSDNEDEDGDDIE